MHTSFVFSHFLVHPEYLSSPNCWRIYISMYFQLIEAVPDSTMGSPSGPEYSVNHVTFGKVAVLVSSLYGTKICTIIY